MKVVPLKAYTEKPGSGVDNSYKTDPLSITSPMVWAIVAPRAGGKTYLASKYLIQEQSKKVPTHDRVYLISATSNSNASYFGKFVDPEDIHLPTKGSIDEVVAKVELDRDDWLAFLEKKELYKKFASDMRSKRAMNDDDILSYLDAGFLLGGEMEKPVWKYPEERPPTSVLIMDDVISTPALSSGGSLGALACKNRHVADLPEIFEDSSGLRRSACGLGLIMLVQTYKSNFGSLPKGVRDNTTHVTLFGQKNDSVIKACFDELGQVVPQEHLVEAYNYCTKDDKYGALTVTMRPPIPELTLRKGLDTALVFEEDTFQPLEL